MRAWWTKYVGIPYLASGRTIAGCDCWGLVRLVYAIDRLIALDNYPVPPSDLAGVARTIANEQMDGRWERIAEGDEQAFDIAVIFRAARVGGRLTWGPFHIGVITDPAHVLHCDETTDAVRMCFRDTPVSERHPAWGRSAFEIFRPRGAST